jgi:hypothetical protein
MEDSVKGDSPMNELEINSSSWGFRLVSIAAFIVSLVSLVAVLLIVFLPIGEKVTTVLYFTSLITVVVTAFMTGKAVSVAKKGRRTQDLFTLMEFLHREEFRDARMKVLEDWTSPVEDKDAWKIASSFDFAGLMVEKGFVSYDVFMEYWRHVLCLMSERLSPFLNKSDFGAHPVTRRIYWKHFDWLMKKAKNR